MAIAFTARGQIGAVAATVTSAAFTPSANSRLWAIASARGSSVVVPTISDSLGGSWTLLPSSGIDQGNIDGAIYYRDIGASPASMTVTCASTAATQVGLMLFDITGAGTDLSNFATDVDTAGDPSLSLPQAPGATGYTIAAIIRNAGTATVTAPTGYSQAYNAQAATNLYHGLYVDASSAAQAQAWVSTSTDAIAYGLEFRESGGPPAMKGMKVWNGSAWTAEKPVKVWTGSAWVQKPVKRWNGSAWV